MKNAMRALSESKLLRGIIAKCQRLTLLSMLLLSLVPLPLVQGATECKTPNLDNTTFIQQLRWLSYLKVVHRSLSLEIQNKYVVVNTEADLRSAISETATFVGDSIVTIKDLLHLKSFDKLKIAEATLLLTKGVETFGLERKLDDSQSSQFFDIWQDALLAALDQTIEFDPVSFAEYALTRSGGAFINLYNTFKFWGLANDILLYQAVDNVLWPYYSFGADFSKIFSYYGYDSSSCGGGDSCFEKYISFANNDTRINSTGKVNEKDLLSLARIYKARVDLFVSNELIGQAFLSKPDLYGPQDGADPGSVVFSWSGQESCDSYGDLIYNLEVHDENGNPVFNAEKDGMGLILQTSFPATKIPASKKLEPNTKYCWAVFPVTIDATTSSAWDFNVDWKCFTTGNLPYPISVTKSGTGSGTIASNPSGIDCGTVCSYSFEQNKDVTLTAAEDQNSQFAGWLGACPGTQRTCLVTMDTSKTVTAIFSANVPKTLNGLTIIGSSSVEKNSTTS